MRIWRPCVAVAPFAKLLHARLEHLVGVKARIFAQQCTRERRDQRLGRVAEREMAGDQAGGGIDLVLAVEGIEQSGADLLGGGRQRHRARRHRRRPAAMPAAR